MFEFLLEPGPGTDCPEVQVQGCRYIGVHKAVMSHVPLAVASINCMFSNVLKVRATYDSHERAPFSISNAASTRTISEGISVTGPSELTFSNFNNIPQDIYFWVLPERFKGDKVQLPRVNKMGNNGDNGGKFHRVTFVFQVTSYGGELRYTITYEASYGAQSLDTQPHVVLQGNGIFLEHYADIRGSPGFPITVTVPFREVRPPPGRRWAPNPFR